LKGNFAKKSFVTAYFYSVSAMLLVY